MSAELVLPERLRPNHRHALPSARRADPREVERQVALVGESPVIAALLQAVDARLLVLNAARQLVASNGPRGDGGSPVGRRPGELLGCVNARSPAGCGTAPACESCGALGAILGCDVARPVASRCVVSTIAGAVLELDVRATGVLVGGERFTVVTLRDVTAEERRRALEQIFFHDVLNTASGLRGWAWHLGRPCADVARAGRRIELLSRRLEREIQDHRALVLAEDGTLVASPAAVEVDDVLDEVAALLSHHEAARDRTIELARAPGQALETDRALLSRVLVNMVRNALEATQPGGTVLLRADDEGGAIRFSVHNAAAMPEDVQAGVFRRSFSTKGSGRGFGTYGMKLLGERYLGGEVSFTSEPSAGTTFSIRVPRRPAPPLPA